MDELLGDNYFAALQSPAKDEQMFLYFAASYLQWYAMPGLECATDAPSCLLWMPEGHGVKWVLSRLEKMWQVGGEPIKVEVAVVMKHLHDEASRGCVQLAYVSEYITNARASQQGASGPWQYGDFLRDKE